MPRIQTAKPQIYGDQVVDPNESFRGRLMKRFASHEWVRVINIDNEPFSWQYLPQHSEEFEFTPDPMKITRRGEVEAYMLDAGDSEVIIGENAFVMIEGLYKRLVSKKVVFSHPNAEKSMARSFNWSDPVQQEDYIDRIFIGKENPQFNVPGQEPVESEAVPETPIINRPKPGPRPKNTPRATRLRKTV